MPSLTWKLIALLTLIFAVAVFLWFIFLGPLSRCERLLARVADAGTTYGAQKAQLRVMDEGCLHRYQIEADRRECEADPKCTVIDGEK